MQGKERDTHTTLRSFEASALLFRNWRHEELFLCACPPLVPSYKCLVTSAKTWAVNAIAFVQNPGDRHCSFFTEPCPELQKDFSAMRGLYKRVC
jgi:hypothetical protein